MYTDRDVTQRRDVWLGYLNFSLGKDKVYIKSCFLVDYFLARFASREDISKYM